MRKVKNKIPKKAPVEFYEFFDSRYAEDFPAFCLMKGLTTKKSSPEEGRARLNAYFNKNLTEEHGIETVRSYLDDFVASKMNSILSNAGFSGDSQYADFLDVVKNSSAQYDGVIAQIKALQKWAARKNDVLDKIEEVAKSNSKEISKKKEKAITAGGAVAGATAATMAIMFYIAQDYPQYLDEEIGKAIQTAAATLYSDYAVSVGMSSEKMDALREVAFNQDIMDYVANKEALDVATEQAKQGFAEFYGASNYADLKLINGQISINTYPNSDRAHAAVEALEIADKQYAANQYGMELDEAGEFVLNNPEDPIALSLEASWANSETLSAGYHAAINSHPVWPINLGFPYPSGKFLRDTTIAFESDIQAQYDALDTGGATPEQLAMVDEAKEMLEGVAIFQEGRDEAIAQGIADSNSELDFTLDNFDLPEIGLAVGVGAVSAAIIRGLMMNHQRKKVIKAIEKNKEITNMLAAEERYQKDKHSLDDLDFDKELTL